MVVILYKYTLDRDSHTTIGCRCWLLFFFHDYLVASQSVMPIKTLLDDQVPSWNANSARIMAVEDAKSREFQQFRQPSGQIPQASRLGKKEARQAPKFGADHVDPHERHTRSRAQCSAAQMCS